MLKIDRRLLAHFDWTLFATVLLLLGCGLATVLSASHTDRQLLSPYFWRQITWSGIGLFGMLLATSFDYHRLDKYSLPLYAISVALLVAVAVSGALAGGARRWLDLGFVSVQPSELSKLAVVILLASLLQRHCGDQGLHWRVVLWSMVWIGLPCVLILEQPDLGTAMILAATGLVMLLVAGLSLRWVGVGALLFAALAPVLWHFLKPYQRRRLETFLNPDVDPLRHGYHIIQSKIAIGSGMWTGKGYLNGTQNRLNFLPEQHTDFIFSVFAEEWGFLGVCLLFAVYLFLLARCWVVITRARDSFGVLLAFGLSALVFLQILVNIGMASGVLPVVGVTLPFFSYGGSSLVVCLVAIGLLLNISMRRFTF